jgi:hypothetical protein
MNFHCIYTDWRVSGMVYGIVSEKDNETTRAVFRSKKITDGQIYPASQLGVLVERLQSDDIIYCIISVDRFLRVSQYVVFCEKVLHAGVSLRCLEQPYLDIGYGRHWRSSIVSQLSNMVRAERVAANRRANCSLLKTLRNENKAMEQGNEILEYSWYKSD